MLKGKIEWIQPTPTPYALVEHVQIVEVSSTEEDPEEDPVEEPEVQEPEPDVEMMLAPEVDAKPVMEPDLVEELAPEPAAEFVEESRPGWLVESDESPSHDYRLE